MIPWLSASALAQDVVTGGLSPKINVQNFRPSVDAPRALWVDEAARAPSGPVGRLLFHYTDDPLVYQLGDEEIGLVRNIVQADLLAGWAFGPARIGVIAPLYLYASGDPTTAAGFGDLALDGRFTVIDGSRTPADLALQGRVTLPTATVDLPLGSPQVGWEIAAIVSKQIDHVLLAVNLGTSGSPASDLENVSLNDAFSSRAALGYDIKRDILGLTGEITSHLSYLSLSNQASSPIEGLLSGWGRPSGDLLIRGGVGTGFTPGIGSPDLRLLAGVSYTPGAQEKDTDHDGLVDSEDSCPTDPEDIDQWQDSDGCPDLDNDSDGVLDLTDACRNDPEDIDRWQDEDGCPDPMTPLKVTVVDEQGQIIDLAKAVLTGPDGAAWPLVRGVLSVEVSPGTYILDGRAGTYNQGQLAVTVPNGAPVGADLILVKQQDVKIVVTRDRIDLKDKVNFETASAKIKPQSFDLLDQAVQILRDYPEIALMRIEGHTDSRGSDTDNLALSKARAASVLQYFVEHGINASRLSSQGFGEARPLDPVDNDAAWAKNRRVDFFIERWEENPTP